MLELNSKQRESALLELSKKRESFPDLAPVLWHSVGIIAVLLQEIISIFPMLSPPTLSPHASNRVCNALALLQCVASHPETKSKLMSGKNYSCCPFCSQYFCFSSNSVVFVSLLEHRLSASSFRIPSTDFIGCYWRISKSG